MNIRSLIVLITLMILTTQSFAQSSISTIDFVKVKDSKCKEALFFYENNWKMYRDIALEKGYIKSYKLLITNADESANFDLILITEYADSSQYKVREERFQEIIKVQRPNGPKLLNELKPNDIRINLFTKEAETMFGSDK